MLDMIKRIILLQNQLNVVNSKLSLLNRMPCMSACQRGQRANLSNIFRSAKENFFTLLLH